jgi:hypothetical protein
MKLGIESLKDLVELISWIVGAVSLAIATYTYRVSRNQFNFSVITNCVERYQSIMAKLRTSPPDERLNVLQRYIDLCNEELFYFKNRYIPEEVVDEWIDGMLSFLPVKVKSENTYINTSYAPEIIEKDLLKDYPRIKKTFTVYRKLDLTIAAERVELLREIKFNVRNLTE